jgi:hypothetical protein
MSCGEPEQNTPREAPKDQGGEHDHSEALPDLHIHDDSTPDTPDDSSPPSDMHIHGPHDMGTADLLPAQDMSGDEGVEPAPMEPLLDLGPPVGSCTPARLPSGKVRICVDLPSGPREYEVLDVDHSFGTRPPPAGTVFADPYTPRPGECSVETHDRYWVRAQDGQVYRTWHPPAGVDVGTGQPCNFGHEHGDDPRTSPLYWWAGGVPFGITNNAAMQAGYHRHEDHYGHKIVVQNRYEVIVGNAPGPDTQMIKSAGFHCYWLSKVHQGTHSGDAIRHNMHEYHNNIMCDDGNSRHPDQGFAHNSGPDRHTEGSVKLLVPWGGPGWIEGCDSMMRIDTGSPSDGIMPPPMSDAKREIKCAHPEQGWSYKDFPVEIVSPTGHPDFAPRDAGIDELWKPWMTVVDRHGGLLFLSSAYYVVRNPIRLYNDGSFIPKRDVDGDGQVDDWIPTLDFCLALGRNYGQCSNLPAFPADVPQTEWWKLPQSPFNGTIRAIHPKGISTWNGSQKEFFCTDFKGQESSVDPTPSANGELSCPAGQLLQRVAPTINRWSSNAAWGQERARGDIAGTMINSRGPGLASGYGHEWVRFFQAPGIHAPN